MAKKLKKCETAGTPKQFTVFTAVAVAVAFLCYWGLKDVDQPIAATATGELLCFWVKWSLIGLVDGLLPLLVTQPLLLVQSPLMP